MRQAAHRYGSMRVIPRWQGLWSSWTIRCGSHALHDVITLDAATGSLLNTTPSIDPPVYAALRTRWADNLFGRCERQSPCLRTETMISPPKLTRFTLITFILTTWQIIISGLRIYAWDSLKRGIIDLRPLSRVARLLALTGLVLVFFFLLSILFAQTLRTTGSLESLRLGSSAVRPLHPVRGSATDLFRHPVGLDVAAHRCAPCIWSRPLGNLAHLCYLCGECGCNWFCPVARFYPNSVTAN